MCVDETCCFIVLTLIQPVIHQRWSNSITLLMVMIVLVLVSNKSLRIWAVPASMVAAEEATAEEAMNDINLLNKDNYSIATPAVCEIATV